jgi:hypothetical protein
MISRSHSRASAILVACAIALTPAIAHAADSAALCASSNVDDVANRPNVAWNSCVVDYRDLLVESGYYQNASSVGSSEIAEYPNVEIRAGVARALELVFDAPTQVDRSLNNGHGEYTFSNPGVGFKYQLSDSVASALSLGAELDAPSTPTSYHGQPKYRIEAEQGRRLGKLDATFGLALVDDHRIARWAESRPALRPSADLGFAATPATSVSVEVLNQTSVARALRSQSFDGLALKETLSKRMLVDIEGGQTINASANTRPHYIGAGLVFGGGDK